MLQQDNATDAKQAIFHQMIDQDATQLTVEHHQSFELIKAADVNHAQVVSFPIQVAQDVYNKAPQITYHALELDKYITLQELHAKIAVLTLNLKIQMLTAELILADQISKLLM